MTYIHLPLSITLLVAVVAASGTAKGPVYIDPQKTDADFAIQGEYKGVLETPDGELPIGVQVVAKGKGQFQAVAYIGGLPGDGYNGAETFTVECNRQDDKVVFRGDEASAIIADDKMTVTDADGYEMGTLTKVHRKSPTLGKKPPKDAVILFDGKGAQSFENGQMSEDQLLMEGTTSKQNFGDQHLHIEFRLPYQPEDSGQQRGNSGVYLQGRYEVQMLDSFGLEGKNNECGGIYERRAPDVNMCLPPLSWQTYDIDFTAARYDADGKLLAKPRLTVRHNGQLVHNDVELPNDQPTRAAPVKAGPDPGPVYLQNHRNPVRYRNIWVIEK